MKRFLGASVGFAAVAIAALCLAWWRNGWDLEASAWTGDAVAPALTTAVLGAMMWTAYLQRRSVDQQVASLQQ